MNVEDSLLRLSLDEQIEQLKQSEAKNSQQNPIDRYLGLARHYYLLNNNGSNGSEVQSWQKVLQAGCKFPPNRIVSTAQQFQLISQSLYHSWFSNNKDQQIFSNFANYLFYLVPIKGSNEDLLANPSYNAIHGFILMNNWELTKSLEKFHLSLYHSPTHYAALMGRAMVKLQLREYNTALTLFQDCYKLVSQLHSKQQLRGGDPRPFIAICLVMLEQHARAKHLFSILLEESPQNHEYKLYLTLMEWYQVKASLRHTRSKNAASVITNEDELKLLENLDGPKNNSNDTKELSPPDLHNFIKVTHETLHQNPQHPLANFMVGEYLYHLGNHSKAAQCFKSVLSNTNFFSSQHLVVDSTYYLGMCHFCSGSLIQAYELFEKTIQLDKSHPLAHFGLAQILLSRGKYQEALTTLEKIKFEIHFKSPDCQVLLLGLESLVTNLVETNKQLAAKKDPYPALLPKTDGIAEKVRPLFQLVLKLVEDAREKKLQSPWLSRAFKVLIEIGKFYMNTSPLLSRTAFFNSLQILVNGKVNGLTPNTPAYAELEIGLLNNLGFVHLEDDVEVSLKYYETALNRLKKITPLNETLKGYQVTISYNIANCLIRLERHDQSKEYLDNLVKDYPKYTSASLTLAHLYHLEDKVDESSEVLKAAEQSLNSSSEKPQSDCRLEGLHTYLGHFETAAQRHEQGFQHYQTNLKRTRDHFTKQKAREIPNARSLIEVGNYYLNLAHHATDKGQRWNYSTKANNHFKKALSQNPKSLYAVHGVAIAFHLMGLLDDSLTIFERLQQESNIPISFQLSYANLLIDLERGEPAIDIYERAFKLEPTLRTDENLIALSKAYYICPQRFNDLAMLLKAESTLVEVLETKPKSRRVKYNLALVRHKYCKAIKRLSIAELPNGVKTLKDALTKLNECQAMFKELLEMGGNSALFKVKFVMEIVGYNEDVERGLVAAIMKFEKLPEVRVQTGDSNTNSPTQLLEGLMAADDDEKQHNETLNSPNAKRQLEETHDNDSESKLAKTDD